MRSPDHKKVRQAGGGDSRGALAWGDASPRYVTHRQDAGFCEQAGVGNFERGDGRTAWTFISRQSCYGARGMFLVGDTRGTVARSASPTPSFPSVATDRRPWKTCNAHCINRDRWSLLAFAGQDFYRTTKLKEVIAECENFFAGMFCGGDEAQARGLMLPQKTDERIDLAQFQVSAASNSSFWIAMCCCR